MDKLMPSPDQMFTLDTVQTKVTQPVTQITAQKPIDTSVFNEFEDSPGHYRNADWDDQWLEITNSTIWVLSTSFPHVIDNYK